MQDIQSRQPQVAPKPPVPTMTTASLQKPPSDNPSDFYEPELVGGRTPAPELGEDITAKPLVMPDFCNIEPSISGRGLSFRWMFTDPRRFSQVRAQGWRVAKVTDVKNGAASPYSVEGGSKFINGDLVLMCIDRQRYLGALKYKHQVAAQFSDAAVQKTIAAQRAVSTLDGSVAAVNQQRMAAGADPVMTVFTPGAADREHIPSPKELSRIGNHEGPADIGNAASLAAEQPKT